MTAGRFDSRLFLPLTIVGAILSDGVNVGIWRRVGPFLVQAGVAAPIMLVMATRKVRQRADGTTVDSVDALVNHVTTMTLASLAISGRSSS